MQTLNEQIHCIANVDDDDKDFNLLKFTNKLKSLFNFNSFCTKTKRIINQDYL